MVVPNRRDGNQGVITFCNAHNMYYVKSCLAANYTAIPRDVIG